MDLFKSLEKDIKYCEHMLELLHSERQALTERNLELLEQIVENKSQVLLDMDKTQKVRDLLLNQLGFEPGSLGLKAVFQNPPAEFADSIKEIEPKLSAMLQEITNMNKINSIMLSTSYTQNSKVLDIILGRDTNQETYGKDGLTESDTNKGSGKVTKV